MMEFIISLIVIGVLTYGGYKFIRHKVFRTSMNSDNPGTIEIPECKCKNKCGKCKDKH